jgi:peptide/nickel transport system ATP-binding protein
MTAESVSAGMSVTSPKQPLLEVRNLSLYIRRPDGSEVQILDDINLSIDRHQALGIIGESGSGKSMTALSILRLLPRNARLEGEVLFEGVDLLGVSGKRLRDIRGQQIAMIFQEPMTALDPTFTIGQQISEVLRAHSELSRRSARARVIEVLDSVGIPDPVRRYGEYPHQLSGGMQQRAMIAMALVCQSKLLIADEPTTAVDITIEAQLLQLLGRLNKEFGLAVMLITHDIGVVAEFCDRIAVMYAGQIVEEATTDDLLVSPAHPYASGLMRSIPRTGSRGKSLYAIPGRVPAPGAAPAGCRFHPRCNYARDSCGTDVQILRRHGLPADARHVRCERADELRLPGAVPTAQEAAQ